MTEHLEFKTKYVYYNNNKKKLSVSPLIRNLVGVQNNIQQAVEHRTAPPFHTHTQVSKCKQDHGHGV